MVLIEVNLPLPVLVIILVLVVIIVRLRKRLRLTWFHPGYLISLHMQTNYVWTCTQTKIPESSKKTFRGKTCPAN